MTEYIVTEDEYRAAMEKVFGKGACYVLSVRQAGGTKVEL